MWTTAIVEVEVAPDRCAGLGYTVVGFQIHLLVLDAAPQPLDEDIVPPGALAVHADGDAVFDQHAGECRAGELAALIRVEDLRLAVASDSVLKRFDAERRLHRDRDAPRQHATAEPIEHNGQIDKAPRHRDVGDVHRPHLVWLRDLDAAQQIRIDLVSGFWLGRARTAIERLYPHSLHQRFHVTAADLAPFGRQQASQHP